MFLYYNLSPERGVFEIYKFKYKEDFSFEMRVHTGEKNYINV